MALSSRRRRHCLLYVAGPAVVCIAIAAAAFMIVQGCHHVLPCVLPVPTAPRPWLGVHCGPRTVHRARTPDCSRTPCRRKDPARQWLHLLVLALLASNFAFNYFRAITTDPGSAASPAYARLLRSARDAGLVSACALQLPQ
jgi:hypothetical protein